jgi:hypothetical protein
MEKKNSILKIIWAIIPAALAAGLMAVSREKSFSVPETYIFYLLSSAGICAWGYVSFRAVFFRRKLVYFIQKIMENDYQSGVKTSPGSFDEISSLERMVNKMADQLRAYDQLQIDKISALTRAIDIIYHNVKEGIIVYTIDKKSFQVNPVVQRFFEVEQENFSYDSLAKQEANKDFILMLKEAIEKGKSTRDAILALELPIRQSRRQVRLTIIPIKDKNEIVELAIILVDRKD